jgi:hypothetical protein
MTDTESTSTAPVPRAHRTELSAWAVGWSAFAGAILVMVGIFQVIAGLVAILEDEFFVVTAEWVFQFDATAWGWIHLLLGLVLLVSGFGIFARNVLARSVGVAVAILSAIAAFMWLPYYPFWGIAIIALDVAVIWALTTQGREVTD